MHLSTITTHEKYVWPIDTSFIIGLYTTPMIGTLSMARPIETHTKGNLQSKTGNNLDMSIEQEPGKNAQRRSLPHYQEQMEQECAGQDAIITHEQNWWFRREGRRSRWARG
jgi:hypothetical protein